MVRQNCMVQENLLRGLQITKTEETGSSNNNNTERRSANSNQRNGKNKAISLTSYVFKLLLKIILERKKSKLKINRIQSYNWGFSRILSISKLPFI